MEKEQTALSFGKGITNVPSDATCDDNDLEECVGMTFADGEHRVIQKPVTLVGSGLNYKLLYVHKVEGDERYIFVVNSTNTHYLGWGKVVNGAMTDIHTDNTILNTDRLTATSIGRTLIITGEKEKVYYLWKNDGTYEAVKDLPDIQFDCWLEECEIIYPGGTFPFVYTDGAWPDITMMSPDSEGWRRPADTDKDVYKDLVLGLYAENKKKAAQKKCFAEPFFVRLALELYDGSFTKITQPVLMFPSVTHNSDGTLKPYENVSKFRMYTLVKKLILSQSVNYSRYSDIVRNVTVFISGGIRIHDDGEYMGWYQWASTSEDPANDKYRTDEIYGENMTYHTGAGSNPSGSFVTNVQPFYTRPISEILEDIENTSVFYKLCEIGLNSVSSLDLSQKIDTHTIENLTTQQQLPSDDYYARTTLYGESAMVYNNRLHLTGVKRGVFEGFDLFLPFDHAAGTTYLYTFYVKIVTPTQDVWVRHTKTTRHKQGIWFYYPDSRAKHVTIYKNVSGTDVCVCDEELTEHTGLNGSYFFKGLPGAYEDEEVVSTVSGNGFRIGTDEYDNAFTESLSNYMLVSDVNNPFIFPASGYVQVGTGRVIGFSSITQALSQGQFGQFPMIVFADSGIWAASVGSTGIYTAVQPISREVCNNPQSIVQTDGAVFFSSERGLNVVIGSEVKWVSAQLGGKLPSSNERSFTDFLSTAFIAYDYRDSLLWIFDGRKDANGEIIGSNYCYIYSVKQGVFSKRLLTDFVGNNHFIDSVINAYPDFIMQEAYSSINGHTIYSGSKVHSLVHRPDINEDGEVVNNVFVYNTYGGNIITRPMKFDNALALKSIRQIRNVSDMEGSVSYRLYASNDLKSWVELRTLRGMPWKYYKMRFDFSGLKATDRFAGTVVVTQERRTNKLR